MLESRVFKGARNGFFLSLFSVLFLFVSVSSVFAGVSDGPDPFPADEGEDSDEEGVSVHMSDLTSDKDPCGDNDLLDPACFQDDRGEAGSLLGQQSSLAFEDAVLGSVARLSDDEVRALVALTHGITCR